MDSPNLFQRKFLPQKTENSHVLKYLKIKTGNFQENKTKKRFSLKSKFISNETNKKETEKEKIWSKNKLDHGKYFLKGILKMKREINKNEFPGLSEDKDDIKINENKKILKQIGNNLLKSINNLKIENGFNFSPRKSVGKRLSKLMEANSIRSSINSPIKEKEKNNKIVKKEIMGNTLNKNNLDNSANLDNDLSSGQLLINNKNNSKLEILNKDIKAPKLNYVNNKNEIINKSKKFYNLIYMNIRKEKFRKLSYKKHVYDSFDDEEELEDQINKDFYILPNSAFIMILDTLIALIVLYNLTYNPYYMASTITFSFSNIFNFYEILNFFMEIIYIIDFFVQFFRAYYDFDDNLITNKKKIILNYLSSWFILDLITIIPIFTLIKIIFEKEKYKYGKDYICNYGCKSDNIFNAICLIKVIKIFKILDRNQNQFISLISSYLTNSTFIDDWGTIIFEVILAIFSIHITTCIHIIIGRNSYPNWIIANNLSEKNFYEIYISSIYFLIATMTSVGYGDITGNSLNEHTFQIFLLIVGIIAYSWFVSSVSNYVMENNKDSIYFSNKVNILEEIKLVHPEMDNDLYKRIYSHLRQLKIIQKRKDKNILLDSLPYNLKNSLLYEINKPLIEGLNFFKNFRNSEFILSAVTKLFPIITNKGDIIIEQNEIINNMIFVKEGRLGVELAIDMNNINNIVNDYINGRFILGEEEKNKDDKLKLEKFKKNNSYSLMSTFNYTMKENFFDNTNKNINLSYKKPVSFRKNLLKFMDKKLKNNNKSDKSKIENKIKYVRLFYIRKGEHFGEIFMFLNRPSCFTLRVKSQKAELLLLRKIDAIEISSNYPNIWKRVNKKSFKNLINLKELVSREVIKFCGKNGIKYNKSFKPEEIKYFNSLPNDEKFEKVSNNPKKKDLENVFKKFSKKQPLIKEKEKERKKKENNNKSLFNKKSKPLIKENQIINKNFEKNLIKENDVNKSIINKNNINDNYSNEINKNIVENLIPEQKYEINDEIYKDEIFLENMNSSNNNGKYLENENSNLDSFEEKNLYEYKKNKKLLKLIESNRGKNKNIGLYYHKNKKKSLNHDCNDNYNKNNSLNIQQFKNNSIFQANKLSIENSVSLNINKIYDNLNEISKGNYQKDFTFQKKIKSLIINKYINNSRNSAINITNNIKIKNNVINSVKKITKYNKSISNKKTFLQRNSKTLSLTKELGLKSDENKIKNKFSLQIPKKLKSSKIQNIKKVEEKNSSVMLDLITKNIIEGEKNLNNPEIFYNELFTSIIQSNSKESSKKNIKIKNSIKNKSLDNKKINKKSLFKTSINPK